MSNKSIKSDNRIKNHIKSAKRAGSCIQCQYPWHDGICECAVCQKWQEPMKNEIAAIARLLLSQGYTDIKGI